MLAFWDGGEGFIRGHTQGASGGANEFAMNDLLRYCEKGGLVVSGAMRVPEDPSEYKHPAVYGAVGCSRLRCTRCGEWVRHQAGVSCKDDARAHLDELFVVEDWRRLPYVATSERSFLWERLDVCRCSAWLELSAHPMEDPEFDPMRDPVLPWRCAGHPAPELPLEVNGEVVGEGTNWRDLISKIRMGWAPVRLGNGDREGPAVWLCWLYSYLQGLPDADALSAAAGDLLATDDPRLRGIILFFFAAFPHAVGFEKVLRSAEAGSPAAREMGLKAWAWMEKAAEKFSEVYKALGESDCLSKIEAILKAAGEQAWAAKMVGAVNVKEPKGREDVKRILTEPGALLSEMMVHLDGFGRDVMGPLSLTNPEEEVREVFQAVDEAHDAMVARLQELLREDLGEGYSEFVKEGGVKESVAKLDLEFVLDARRRFLEDWKNKAMSDKGEREKLKKKVAGRSKDITMGSFKEAMDWKTGTGGWNWKEKRGVGGLDFEGCKRRVLSVDFRDEDVLRKVADATGLEGARSRPVDDLGADLISRWTDPSRPPPWWIEKEGDIPWYHAQEVKEAEVKQDVTFGKYSKEHYVQKLKSGTVDTISLLVGPKANRLNPDHVWVKYARALNMPLRSGVSGTTNRLLNTGTALGMSPVEVRLPVLGHLLKVEAHSYHEIMSAAATHGAPYTPGDYKSLAPLKWEGELVTLWERAEKKIKGDGKVGGTFV